MCLETMLFQSGFQPTQKAIQAHSTWKGSWHQIYPQDDTQPSAALYRTVCGGDVAAVNFLLQNGHDPNVPYYYIPQRKLASRFKHDVGESIEDERGMFHYPLHRAVLQDNMELVELLLDHGADPEAVDGRSNTPLTVLIKTEKSIDSLIAEKLILSGADKNVALYKACHGENECNDSYYRIKWLVVKTLLWHGADLRKLLSRTENPFLNVVLACHWDKTGVAFEVLREFVDCGLDACLLKKALEGLVLDSISDTVGVVRTVTILLEMGFDVDFDLSEKYKHFREYRDGYTLALMLLERLNYELNDVVRHSKCRELKIERLFVDFSLFWVLVKAGAQLKLNESENLCEKLVSMEVTLNTIYDKTECATRETWSEPRHSTVLGHLEHCKEIMTWMGTVRPQSLFELCALAVRKSIGVNLGPKVARLNIPQFCLGAVSIRKTVLPGMAIPMLKIRRPNGRLIFNMEIAIRR